MVQTVFFTRKAYNAFSVDSTVRFHDAPGSRSVYPEVYSQYPVDKSVLILYKGTVFLKREPYPVLPFYLFYNR